ncbi:MAG: 16S rRNA (cytosine(1402)-N(4))-methyltransferase [Candidatus Omnitrophica bacterium]|nr:16S rRNA (cytosine(1402)-N(4))-methyltransferase [Candidatus Omnitrophota bacterium]
MAQKFHTAVMLGEVLDYLTLSPGNIIVDATIGTGGHSQEILKRILPKGRLIGIDRDEESLAVCRERLRNFSDSCEFLQGNFLDLDTILKSLNIKKVDGILFDLGISSFQLEDPLRGFSFQNEGPLDMRLDRNSYISAYDLRERQPITTTLQLANIVVRSIPHRYRHRYYRIHPATRTFQAVRIAVNRELEILEIALEKAIAVLGKKARVCIISFHSLEDRVAKFSFRKYASEGLIEIITAKPLTPGVSEVEANPSSRSAKLRVAEKL